jgi:mRNA interferase MazF
VSNPERLALLRGDVVYVDLRGAVGSEKQGTRPCVVVQNNGGNRGSPLTIIVPLTDSDHQGKRYPQQVLVSASELGPGGKDSVIECGLVREIDRDGRIDIRRGVWCHLDDEIMRRVDAALRASLEL